MEFKYKSENPDVNKRKTECDQILNRFPEKIPIICERDPKSNIKEIDKTKYLVPQDLTASQFNFMIRKRIEIPKEQAFFLLVNGKKQMTGDESMSDIYKKEKDPEDGFLYICYASELTWGNN